MSPDESSHSPTERPKWVDPAARGANVGSSETSFASSEAHLDQAVQRFNVSQEARTVAGLTRTLGEPWVSIGAAAGSPSEVRITVAWELSWYQWGVDLGDDLRPVTTLDKGYEVDQLDRSARQWNATAVDGQLSLGAPVRSRAPSAEPVGR